MVWLLLAACGPSAPADPCASDDTVLVTPAEGAPLTCVQARAPTRFLRLLAGRPLPAGATAAGVAQVRERFLTDPAATRAWLDGIHARGKALESASGLEAAELRATEAWRLVSGQGPFTAADPGLWASVQPALTVRARHDGHQLALTEADIEGWIHYASLGHEVRGRGVIRTSIANKADIYAMVSERFERGTREEQVALVAFGAVWEQVRERWQGASYDAQQAWIAEAPIPPAFNATSLAWVEAVLEGDLPAHAAVLHRHLGPLHVREGYFP